MDETLFGPERERPQAARIVSQWDFDHQIGKFISTQGYTFLRDKKTKQAVLVAEYTFPQADTHTVACSVQNDQGGERTVVQVIEVR